jgi:hypothetical protein
MDFMGINSDDGTWLGIVYGVKHSSSVRVKIFHVQWL